MVMEVVWTSQRAKAGNGDARICSNMEGALWESKKVWRLWPGGRRGCSRDLNAVGTADLGARPL